MKEQIGKLMGTPVPAYMTVEAAYVLPMAIGVFLFCMGMFFFVYDRGVLYQNMLRQGIVMQMESDEEKDQHEISLLPTMNLQSQNLSVERGEEEIRVSCSAIQRNPLKNLSFMPIYKNFESSAQTTLPEFDPVEHLRDIRKALWLARQAEDVLTR